jgi:hypothetical protein
MKINECVMENQMTVYNKLRKPLLCSPQKNAVMMKRLMGTQIK